MPEADLQANPSNYLTVHSHEWVENDRKGWNGYTLYVYTYILTTSTLATYRTRAAPTLLLDARTASQITVAVLANVISTHLNIYFF